MLWLALIHGANGMRTIVNDYVTHRGVAPRARAGRSWLRRRRSCILLGTLVVFTFDPCLGVDAADSAPDARCACA